MTEEELKEEIIKLLLKPISCKMFSDVWLEHKAVQILTLIKEADWKSPEEWNKNEIKRMNIVQGMREAK